MRTVLRFIARVDVGIGLLVAAAVIGATQGKGLGLSVLVGWGMLVWYARTALGGELRKPPHRQPPSEHFVEVAACAPSDGQNATLERLDPAWRKWLAKEASARPPH